MLFSTVINQYFYAVLVKISKKSVFYFFNSVIYDNWSARSETAVFGTVDTFGMIFCGCEFISG